MNREPYANLTLICLACGRKLVAWRYKMYLPFFHLHLNFQGGHRRIVERIFLILGCHTVRAILFSFSFFFFFFFFFFYGT